MWGKYKQSTTLYMRECDDNTIPEFRHNIYTCLSIGTLSAASERRNRRIVKVSFAAQRVACLLALNEVILVNRDTVTWGK